VMGRGEAAKMVAVEQPHLGIRRVIGTRDAETPASCIETTGA
jgi:hypothetical protein